mmetsp:Transcript_1084/g.1938  ORF Transcript_1084/g.1938 Transcript_1084/m.1938 type:complete len:506 (-) Transcript_1084:146-1663(-)
MTDNASLSIRCLNITHPLVLPDSDVVTEQLSAMLQTEIRHETTQVNTTTTSINNTSRRTPSTTSRRSSSSTTTIIASPDEDETVMKFRRDSKEQLVKQEISSSSYSVGPRNLDYLRDKLSTLSVRSNNNNSTKKDITNPVAIRAPTTTTANTISGGSSSVDDKVNLRPGINPHENSSQQESQRNIACSAAAEEREKNALYRSRMSEWAYRIIDHFGASRENVAIAFEYLDRLYVSGLFICKSSFDYKLASITALYIALKVHNRTTIKASTLSSLSRGEISVGDIIAMESLMLDALSYHLCPPTCYTFVSLFYTFVPVSVRESVGHPLMQHAIYQTELSVMDISFQTLKASHIALAAMLNVIEMMGEDAMPSWARSSFVRDVEQCMLKARLQRRQGDAAAANVTRVVVDGINTRTIEGEDEKDNEEDCYGSLTSQHPRPHDEESLYRKHLWHSVHSTQEMLWSLLSRHTCMDQENMFFFSTGISRRVNQNDDDVVEGRDDTPSGRI